MAKVAECVVCSVIKHIQKLLLQNFTCCLYFGHLVNMFPLHLIWFIWLIWFTKLCYTETSEWWAMF